MKNLLLILLISISNQLFSQSDSIRLIKPTGNYPVGTITYEYTDTTRDIQLTSHKGDKRTINVQIWYPATTDSSSISAPYSSLSKDYQKVSANSFIRPSFNDEIDISNLIIIAPGRGTERFLYTSIAEELASYGFVVASVDMPQIGYVIYKDGLIIKPSSKFKPPRGMMGGPYEKVDKFFEEPTELGYHDLEFAYNKIVELNRADPNNRFTNKIDCENIGIFGHSLGGRIAGKFTVQNKNVKAYISMEGIPPRDIRYNGKIDIPIAMLCSSGTWPYAKENYFSLIENRNSPVYMIELESFGHNSVTDNPLIYPSSFNYNIDPILGLEISRTIVLNYFNFIFYNKISFSSSLQGIEQVKLSVYK